MTRIDELQKKYPGLPREIIIKWEVLGRGVKDTEDLDKVSLWERAAGSYVTYDYDTTQKEVQEKRAGKTKPGFVLSPKPFHMKNGLGVELRRHSTSPYEIRDLGDDRFALFEGEEKVEEVYFLHRRQREERLTSKGTPVESLVRLKSPRCFDIFPVRHCEYFTTGDQCKFCNFQSIQEDIRSLGVYRPTTINLDETVEAYRILASEVKLLEGRAEMGSFVNGEAEGKLYLSFLERIASAASHKPVLNVRPQPMSRKEMQRLKDVGVDCLTMQMEVWDPNLFEEVCPGKAKSRGREGYIEAFHAAVEVFGAGKAGCNFVAGVNLVAANGPKSWQEARDSHAEGDRWMIKHGVWPVSTPLRLQPGSIYGDNPANQDKYPPTEFYLEMGMANHQAMKEYGLYTKVNKLMWCAMDCLNVGYEAEIGIVELAGDVGTWLSDQIPDEDNWLAKFVSSVSQPAKTQ